MDHPPYRPDLEPRDFHLLRPLEEHLAFTRSAMETDIKKDNGSSKLFFSYRFSVYNKSVALDMWNYVRGYVPKTLPILHKILFERYAKHGDNVQL